MDKFIKGKEDVYRRIQLTIDSVAADTSNFTEIEVIIKHKINRSLLVTLTLMGGTVEKESPNTSGYINFIIDRSDHSTADIGDYEAEIVTDEIDLDYEDDIRQRGLVVDCFTLI